MRGDKPEPFYINLWCSLAEDGWESTGADSYGLIRWQKSVETGHKHIAGRLCFITRPNQGEIHLETRHIYHGMATKKLCSGETRFSVVKKLVDESLPELVNKTIEQYLKWCDEIEKEYK